MSPSKAPDPKVPTENATALVSPISASLSWASVAPLSVVLTLTLVDATGASKVLPVPLTRCTSDNVRPKGVVPPSAKKGALFEAHSRCGPETESSLRVLADGAGLVVKYRTIASLHDEAGTVDDTGWDDLLRVNLAPGAEVRAR